MQEEFFKKVFQWPKLQPLRKLIYNFQEREDKSFHASWERYKDLLNTITHYGYDTDSILRVFYKGISPQTRPFINMMYNGQFMRKSLGEALDFFDELVEHNQLWDISYVADRTRYNSSQNTSGHGKYTLKE